MVQEIYAFRCSPGQDLMGEIQSVVQRLKIEAGWIITCVGSLTDIHLRFANGTTGTKRTGHFEIVSLAGTVGRQGCHLHMSVSNELGEVMGGHVLMENWIYTTAEIVIGYNRNLVFLREKDEKTGWKELVIKGPDEWGHQEQ